MRNPFSYAGKYAKASASYLKDWKTAATYAVFVPLTIGAIVGGAALMAFGGTALIGAPIAALGAIGLYRTARKFHKEVRSKMKGDKFKEEVEASLNTAATEERNVRNSLTDSESPSRKNSFSLTESSARLLFGLGRSSSSGVSVRKSTNASSTSSQILTQEKEKEKEDEGEGEGQKIKEKEKKNEDNEGENRKLHK